VALEQAVAAPFCSRQLADMGADVVKIERPGGGDFARAYDGALNGLSAYFAWLNRGKRSVTLDVKGEVGQEVMGKLLETADVFIHNLAPGAVERLGWGYEETKEIFPRLVWVGISGYGPDGPYCEKKAYDMLIQAEAGVVSLTGTPETAAKVGISIADISAGLYGYASILTALLNREKTGRGERIDISMFECLTEWLMPPLNVFMGTGKAPVRAGLRHNMIIPYGAYPCLDGEVVFSIQNEREWKQFCEGVLEQPALADDPRFITNDLRLEHRTAIETIIEEKFSTQTASAIIERLEQANIAYAAVNDVASVAEHPQLAARGRWANVASQFGTIQALIPPHNLASISPQMGKIPSLGEHTVEVLAELGFADRG
jgi:crotonobetainyl-CoA:carnitine CoA-transferase CaiB-like acyl-CoA transferase